MMEERVIVVDYNDKPIGNGSKKESELGSPQTDRDTDRSFCSHLAPPAFVFVSSAAHIMTSINAGLLHRAFSVFLFTPDGRLILQQRSGEFSSLVDTHGCGFLALES